MREHLVANDLLRSLEAASCIGFEEAEDTIDVLASENALHHAATLR